MSNPSTPIHETIVTNPTLRIDRISILRADNAGTFGDVIAEGSEAIQTVVPPKYQHRVQSAFADVTTSPESTVAVTLTQPVYLVQYTTDRTSFQNLPQTPYFATQYFTQYFTPENNEARSLLALPNTNKATNHATYCLAPGRTVLVGTCADMSDDDKTFGEYAIGSATQVYVPDFDTNPPERIG